MKRGTITLYAEANIDDLDVLPLDVTEELTKPNICALNLKFSYYPGSLRFWISVGSRFSLAGRSGVICVLNSLPGNETFYPDANFVVTKGNSAREDYYFQAQEIDLTADACVLIIPRLVEISNTGQAKRYYLDAWHQSEDVRLALKPASNGKAPAFCEWVLTCSRPR